MATNKSTVEVAYEILSTKKRAIQFSKLWSEVAKQTKSSDDRAAEFYSDLTMDGRFARLKDNKWDLKARRKFEESFVDLKKIELDEDNEEELIQEDDGMMPTSSEDEY